MGVVTKYAASAKDPASISLASAVLAEGRLRAINVPTVTVTNGDSSGSLFYLGKIASNAVPLVGLSTLKHDAITGVNSAHIGLYKDGTAANASVLASALDLSSAGAKDPFAAITFASVGKQIYELLGLANDPGLEYDVVLKINADASATKTFGGAILYSKK